MSILDQKKVLVLNGAWVVIGEKTVQQALSDLCAGSFMSIDFTDGYMVPTKWEAWVKLPVREGDDVIRTSHAQVRVPRVLIATGYKKVPVKRKKKNLKNIAERDDDTCQLTGRKLKRSEMSIEHVVPRSKGGKDDWDNVVLAHRDVNSMRGNLPYEKVGLKTPMIRPAPRAKPASETIQNTYGLPEWDMILGKQ
jgi:5-methylcytosine-specific restriction endonuclease McrA